MSRGLNLSNFPTKLRPRELRRNVSKFVIYEVLAKHVDQGAKHVICKCRIEKQWA